MSMMQGFVRMACAAFPFLAEGFPFRSTAQARVLSCSDRCATVQPIDRDGGDDDALSEIAELRLPFYCKSLGVGSIVRIGFDWWDAGHPYITDIIEAITPTWELTTGTTTTTVNPSGDIECETAGVTLTVTAAGIVELGGNTEALLLADSFITAIETLLATVSSNLPGLVITFPGMVPPNVWAAPAKTTKSKGV